MQEQRAMMPKRLPSILPREKELTLAQSLYRRLGKGHRQIEDELDYKRRISKMIGSEATYKNIWESMVAMEDQYDFHVKQLARLARDGIIPPPF